MREPLSRTAAAGLLCVCLCLPACSQGTKSGSAASSDYEGEGVNAVESSDLPPSQGSMPQPSFEANPSAPANASLGNGATGAPASSSSSVAAPGSRLAIPSFPAANAEPARSSGAAASRPAASSRSSVSAGQGGGLACLYWYNLRKRLSDDGIRGARVDAMLESLPPLIQKPMGHKVRAAYKKAFFPSPAAPGAAPKVDIDPQFVTEKNAATCRSFISAHKSIFSEVERAYGVPASVGAALLFNETRLGRCLGDLPQNAFHVLASMAQCQKPEDISEWLPKMKDVDLHMDWVEQRVSKYSLWAYNELKALIVYMLENNLAPDHFPSSIYGAIGICQFMPSNIKKYAADGNHDGVIDLFNLEDAAMSMGRYLYMHGWKKGMSRSDEKKCIYSYNHSDRYVNNTLGLSDLIMHRPVEGLPALSAGAVAGAGAAAAVAAPKAAPKVVPSSKAAAKATPKAKPASKAGSKAAAKPASKAGAKATAKPASKAAPKKASKDKAASSKKAPAGKATSAKAPAKKDSGKQSKKK